MVKIYSDYIKSEIPERDYSKIIQVFVAILGLWLGASELLHWLDTISARGAYKGGLSIWFGVYSLGLIAFEFLEK